MAIKFSKLTAAAVKALSSGKSINEHGITAKASRNGDVAWSVNLMVDGTRIHRAVGRRSEGVTREQCERVIEALRTHAREERLNLPKGRKVAETFADASAKYLLRMKEEGGKALNRKAVHIETRLNPFFGAFRSDAITEGDTKRYSQLRKTQGVKAGTVNRELATLSHVLKSLARWGWIAKDKVPEIGRLREGQGRIIALSKDQSLALLECAKKDQDPDLWLFVQICLQTSMRHGEARKLRWEHFDGNRRRFFIPEAKAGEREQPVPAELASTLATVRGERGHAEGYLFKAGPGSRTGYRHTFRKAFRRAVTRAGLNPDLITPHVLRHTAITRLVKAGVDLPTIQKVSGHRTLSMVLRYAHVDGSHIDGAVEHLSL